jgi:NRAMP (natural resistance-associated macrophage protein)-like metal ion transporter
MKKYAAKKYSYTAYKNLKSAARIPIKIAKGTAKVSKRIGQNLQESYKFYRIRTNSNMKSKGKELKSTIGNGMYASKKLTGKVRKKYGKGVYKYWDTLGPGLTTGAADDDPSGITTYSQTGAKYGFKLLWLSLFTYPLMAVIQEMCARIGLTTGKGLAANIRERYPTIVIFTCTFLLLVANVFNIGADLGAMATSTRLIFPQFGFVMLLLFFTVLSLGLQIFTKYPQYAKYLKYLAFTLFSYVFVVLIIKNLDWGEILRSTIIPSIQFSKEQIILICAILGTTISPYLFFWQSSNEVEEACSRQEQKLTKTKADDKEFSRGIKEMRIDVWSGMFVSNLVMFFIIAATSATLFSHGINNIGTAADAAEALRPLAGEQAYLLFTIGIIGSGLLAVPILAGSASYAVSESLRARSGLSYRFREAPIFYGVIILSMMIGFFMNFLGINIIKALIYSAVINGLVAPIILFFIVKISSDRKTMGYRMNHPLIKFLGWFLVAVMTVVGIATIVSFFL